MSSQLAMSLMSTLEVLLWAVLGFLFWKNKLHRRFPAMGAYLVLRVASTPLLLVFLLNGGCWGPNEPASPSTSTSIGRFT